MNVAITERVRAGLDRFVIDAAKSALAAEASSVEIAPLEAPAQGAQVVMLTISTYTFRVLIFLHFDTTAATREYMAALARKSLQEMRDEQFRDAMMECGNLICGAVNRDLAAHYPHVGMSTANVLSQRVMEHLAAVEPRYTRRFRAQLAPAVSFDVTLALCTREDLDFAFETRAAAEAVSELELF